MTFETSQAKETARFQPSLVFRLREKLDQGRLRTPDYALLPVPRIISKCRPKGSVFIGNCQQFSRRLMTPSLSFRLFFSCPAALAAKRETLHIRAGAPRLAGASWPVGPQAIDLSGGLGIFFATRGLASEPLGGALPREVFVPRPSRVRPRCKPLHSGCSDHRNLIPRREAKF